MQNASLFTVANYYLNTLVMVEEIKIQKITVLRKKHLLTTKIRNQTISVTLFGCVKFMIM